MQFPTLTFALFFLVVFSVSWALVRHDWGRKVFLLGASYLFYACADWSLGFLLAGSSLVNWLGARGLAAARRDGRPDRARRILVLGVLVNLGLLGFFKYTGFGIRGLNSLLELLGTGLSLPYLAVILPVGISFFTFQGLSLLVDTWRGELAEVPGAIDTFLYIAFFPQLVAGPIVRAGDFLPQLARRPDPRGIPAGRAFGLIAAGLGKKIVLAGPLGSLLVDPVFANPGQSGGLELLVAILGYGAQIYCDFSAYSDIAIGIALLQGYRFPPNFDQPYRARSLQEFWRRWHISLSTWLRDYLYIPLGGSRRGKGRTLVNLLVTMVLGGLWHGASLGFVVWGALHGLALVAERLCGWPGRRAAGVPGRGMAIPGTLARLMPGRRRLAGLAGLLWTTVVVQLGWVFFRAESLDQAGSILAGLTRPWDRFAVLNPALLGLVLLVYALQWLPAGLRTRLAARVAGLPLPAWAGLAAALAFGLGAASQEGMASFIYFRF